MSIEREIQRIADTDQLHRMINDVTPGDKVLVIIQHTAQETMSFGILGDVSDPDKVYLVEAFKNIIFNGGCSCPPESPE